MRMIFTALLWCLCRSAGAQTPYADYASFRDVASKFAVFQEIGFDLQAPGTPVSAYGPLSISASGLASDGITVTSIPLAVTEAYPTTSGNKGLGPAVGSQFLGGNSDRIVFTFRDPVNAFGVRIVGNPSPTGTPAIPFWKLRVNIDKGFDAYSSTVPISSLGGGNDVYFVGVVSQGRKFSQVELYSDNDPAAVFSFNCDDITFASLPDAVTIPKVKALDGGEVTILDAIVTHVHDRRFNIATASPLSGIAVLGDCPVDPNTSISLWGKVTQTSDEEWVIELGDVFSVTENADAPGPFVMQSKCIGGSTDIGLQRGIEGSVGLNNIGLDVTLCGRITAVGPDWITVDDGCGMFSGMLDSEAQRATGIKIAGKVDMASYSVGEFVVVWGSVSVHTADGKRLPLIRVGSPMDVCRIEVKK